MSKTKVNVIDPLDTASVYGADTLMEKIEGGELFNMLEGLTTMATTTTTTEIGGAGG